MRARHAALAFLILLASREASGEPAPISNRSGTLIRVTATDRRLCKPAPDPLDVDVPAGLFSGAITTIDGVIDVWCRVLPPGRFVDEDTWQHIDAEHRRLQDAETRLGAENRSLRESVSGWQPGWKTLAATLVIGFVGGAAAYHYARD